MKAQSYYVHSKGVVENGHVYVVMRNKHGDIFWYLNGQCHRELGPAVEYVDGTKFWYRNDKFHREDGPAIERADGSKQWYLDNTFIDVKSNEEFLRFKNLMVFM